MKLSELPLMDVILAAEKKHGTNVHMVIEAVPKNDNSPEDIGGATEDDIVWWVEFENLVKSFEKFDDVKKFLLDEVVAKNKDLVVKLTGQIGT
jgi:hypothetical protein